MLRLVTFGALAVENSATVNGSGNARSRLAVLAVIAVAGHRGIRREKLTALFWPDSDDERARNALRQTLFVLKRDLGGAELTVGTADLRLNPDVITSDISEFESARREGRLADAVAVYSGPFLDGVYLKESSEFERWCANQAASLAAEYGRLLERLAVSAGQQGDMPSSIEWWRRAAAHDRLSSRIARAYMEALIAGGDREAAIRHSAQHATAVRAELESEPDAELLLFAERLRSAPPPAGSAVRTVAIDADANVGWEPAPSVKVHEVAPRQRGPLRQLVRRPVVWLVPLALAAVVALRSRDLLPGVEEHLRAGSLGELRQIANAPKLPESPDPSARVLVVPLENETGDSANTALGQVAAEWMTEGLQRIGLDVVDAHTARLALHPPGQRRDGVTVPDLASLAARANATLVLGGRIYKRQDSLEVWTQLVEPRSGRIVRALPAVKASTNELNALLVALRSRALGAVAQAVDGRAELITAADKPPTYEAYREYVAGLEVYVREPWNPAGLAHFLRAARLDTTFMLPLIWAAHATTNPAVVPRDSAQPRYDSLLARMTAQRNRLSPLEATELEYLEADNRDDLSGRHAAAVRAAHLAPFSQWTYLAGSTAYRLRRYREAITTLHRLNPQRGWVRGWTSFASMLGSSHHLAGEFEEEIADVALVVNDDSSAFASRALRLLVGPLSALGRESDLNAVLDTAAERRPEGPSNVSAAAGELFGGLIPVAVAEARTHGHDALARRLTDRCLRWLHDADAATDTSARNRLRDTRVACLTEAGRFADARAAISTACDMPAYWYKLDQECPYFRYGGLSARIGDTAGVSRMRALIAEIAEHRHELSAYPLMFEARLAAIRGDRDGAVDALRRAIEFQGIELSLHTEIDFASLRGYAPFERLMVPPQSPRQGYSTEY